METEICLDKKEACIVKVNGHSIVASTIESELYFFNIHGGSGRKFKGGSQDVVQDSKYTEREKHQTQNYFKKIVNKITDVSKLIIFGPGEMPLKFYKNLEINFREIFDKIITLEKENSMIDNQNKAYVRDFIPIKLKKNSFNFTTK